MNLKKKCLKLKALATKMKDASPVEHKSKDTSATENKSKEASVTENKPREGSIGDHKKKTLRRSSRSASGSDSDLSNESWNLWIV